MDKTQLKQILHAFDLCISHVTRVCTSQESDSIEKVELIKLIELDGYVILLELAGQELPKEMPENLSIAILPCYAHIQEYANKSISKKNLAAIFPNSLKRARHAWNSFIETRRIPLSNLAQKLVFIEDLVLRQILGRQLSELQGKLIPANAYESTIILGASILESILYFHLEKQRGTHEAEFLDYCITNEKSVDLLERWEFKDYITLALYFRFISNELFSKLETLQDYHNLLHPTVFIRQEDISFEDGAKIIEEALAEIMGLFNKKTADEISEDD